MSHIQEIINPLYLQEEKIKELRAQFDKGIPCKHIVLEDFFTAEIANQLYENFPPLESLKVVRKSLNENKREDYHFERWHPAFTKVRDTFTSKEMGELMSKITGIDGLFTNTDPLGQGIHQGGVGSFLDVHIDVNVNVAKQLWRRINLLVYLNREWKAEYGGDVELWNKEMTKCVVKYPPFFNKAVIFLTDENSPHGYSKLNIPEGESRKSYYAYFFTPLEEGVKYEDSRFLSRPSDSVSKKVATTVKENLKIKAKQLLSMLGMKNLDFQDKND
jgi:hypothetical protein